MEKDIQNSYIIIRKFKLVLIKITNYKFEIFKKKVKKRRNDKRTESRSYKTLQK